MLKIVVVGDSFGLPRLSKNQKAIEVGYEDTYPEQLRQILLNKLGEDVAMINKCRRYKTSSDIVSDWLEDVYLNQPVFGK